jgi:hypothetical protein
LTAGDAEQIREFVTDLLSGYYTDPEDQPPPDAQLH